MTKLCSTTYLRSFVVYLQVLFTKLKVYLCEPSQVLKSGLAYTPQISLIYVGIGEITVSNISQATAAFSLLRFVCRLKLKRRAWRILQMETIESTKILTAVVLAQSVERLNAEREVAGSIPGAGLILRVLK